MQKPEYPPPLTPLPPTRDFDSADTGITPIGLSETLFNVLRLLLINSSTVSDDARGSHNIPRLAHSHYCIGSRLGKNSST